MPGLHAFSLGVFAPWFAWRPFAPIAMTVSQPDPDFFFPPRLEERLLVFRLLILFYPRWLGNRLGFQDPSHLWVSPPPCLERISDIPTSKGRYAAMIDSGRGWISSKFGFPLLSCFRMVYCYGFRPALCHEAPPIILLAPPRDVFRVSDSPQFLRSFLIKHISLVVEIVWMSYLFSFFFRALSPPYD